MKPPTWPARKVSQRDSATSFTIWAHWDLGPSPGFATGLLSDLRQVASPLWVSVSSSVKVGMRLHVPKVPYSMLIPVVAVDTDIKKMDGVTTQKPWLALHKVTGFKVRAISPCCCILLKHLAWISIAHREKEDPSLFAIQGLHHWGPA